jgi:hypothetical protein
MNHDQSTGMNKHLLIMLACCLIPIALILAISVFGLSLGALTPLLPYALVLLCPLMMLFMMRGMGHDHGAADAHHPSTSLKTDAPRPVPTQRIADTTQGAVKTNPAPGREQCH